MKLHVLLYKGDGIGPELFESLRAFFCLFEKWISFEYIEDLNNVTRSADPVYLLSGPLQDESVLDFLISQTESSYTLNVIPPFGTDTKRTPVRILSSSVIGTSSIDSTAIEQLMQFTDASEKTVLLHDYKEAPDQWKKTMEQWAKRAFTKSAFQMEDRSVASFVRHGEYQRVSQVITSEKNADMITAVYISNRKALTYSYTLRKTAKRCIAKPLHGHAPDITAMGIANPLGTIFAFCGLLKEGGYAEIAQKVENQIEKRYFEDSDQITPDMGGILNTEKYMAMISEFLHL